MQLIRNAYQVARYIVTCRADDRIERQLSRIRFGLSDYERNERARKMAKMDRVAQVVLFVCAFVGVYSLLDAYFDVTVVIAEWVKK